MLCRFTVLGLVGIAATVALSPVASAEQPETVMMTLRVRAGSEQALADVIARHYDVARRLHLVALEAPHLTLRSCDDGDQPYFIEILTWRDGDIPDHAPAEILTLWKELTALVESRAGKPGIDIVPMIPVSPAK